MIRLSQRREREHGADRVVGSFVGAYWEMVVLWANDSLAYIRSAITLPWQSLHNVKGRTKSETFELLCRYA